MTIEDRKQLDRTVLEEVNVKSLHRYFGKNNNGDDVFLVFDGQEYEWLIAGERFPVKDQRIITGL